MLPWQTYQCLVYQYTPETLPELRSACNLERLQAVHFTVCVSNPKRRAPNVSQSGSQGRNPLVADAWCEQRTWNCEISHVRLFAFFWTWPASCTKRQLTHLLSPVWPSFVPERHIVFLYKMPRYSIRNCYKQVSTLSSLAPSEKLQSHVHELCLVWLSCRYGFGGPSLFQQSCYNVVYQLFRPELDGGRFAWIRINQQMHFIWAYRVSNRTVTIRSKNEKKYFWPLKQHVFYIRCVHLPFLSFLSVPVHLRFNVDLRIPQVSEADSIAIKCVWPVHALLNQAEWICERHSAHATSRLVRVVSRGEMSQVHKAMVCCSDIQQANALFAGVLHK